MKSAASFRVKGRAASPHGVVRATSHLLWVTLGKATGLS